MMRELKEILTERELYVLKNHPAMTYKAIGIELGISPERVRQLKVHAERMIREEQKRELESTKGQKLVTITLQRRDVWLVIRALGELLDPVLTKALRDRRKNASEKDPDIDRIDNLIQELYSLLQIQ